MTVDTATGELVFSSGRRLYVNHGLIGLNHKWEVSGGYDDIVRGTNGISSLSREELLRVVDYMVALWLAFGAKLQEGSIECDTSLYDEFVNPENPST